MPDQLSDARWPMTAGTTWAIESCTFTWIFDLSRRRFRRVPSGTSVTGPVPPGAWNSYHRLDLHGDAGCFAVTLDPEGTHILRSWRHGQPCRHCGPVLSGLASTADLAELVERWRAEMRTVDCDGRRETGSPGWSAARPRHPFRGRDRRQE